MKRPRYWLVCYQLGRRETTRTIQVTKARSLLSACTAIRATPTLVNEVVNFIHVREIPANDHATLIAMAGDNFITALNIYLTTGGFGYINPVHDLVVQSAIRI